MALIPFGKPFPGIDSVSLRDGVAAGLTNGFINELGDYEKVGGHTLFATHGDAKSIDSLYCTIDGDNVLVLTNGKVALLNANGTFTALTGPTLPRQYAYWAEDAHHVYLTTGAALTRIDITQLTYEFLNENAPKVPTHICRAKGFLVTNGNDVVIGASQFSLSQVFDTSTSLDPVVVLTDKPGWIVTTGRGTVSPNVYHQFYLSKDNGLTWSRPTSSFANPFMLALEYMGGGVVLAGSGNITGRIWRSTDYGATWTEFGASTLGSSTIVNCLRKVTTNVVLAGTGSGGTLGHVWRSTDNGANWTDRGSFGKQVTEIEVLNESSGIVVMVAISASDAIEVWRSTDSGSTFTLAQTLTGAGYVPAIQRLSDTVAVMSNGVTTTTTQKIWRTVDAGSTWVLQAPIPDFPPDAIPYAFCVLTDGSLLMGTAGNNVGVGGAQVWKSLDQGITWNLVNELNTNKAAAIQQRGLKETHNAGTVIATGRIDLGSDGQDTAAKWQTGQGKAPVSVFYSEDFANGYEAVDSWEFFNPESTPDACNGVFEHRSLVYATGPRSIEVNYNSAEPAFPWLVSDPSLPFGLLAPYSWVAWDQLDTIMYLTDTDNVIQVVKFRNRVQQQISQEYAKIINDRSLVTLPGSAKAWGVALRGMPHYVLSFPADNLTICYNVLADHWWRWAAGTSADTAALINSYCYWKTQNRHLVGDRRDNGRIYTLGGLTDNGTAIRFELTSGNISRDTDRLKLCGSVTHKVKRGQATDISEPHFRMRMRDDGQGWSRYASVSLGWARQTELFAPQYHLGSYHARQWQIVHDDTKSDFIYSHGDEEFTVGRY